MSEYVPMADTGCDVSPSCLKCPLPQCKFENPAYTPHQADKHRLYAGVYAARLAGETVNGLAERFGVSGRTVSRIIAAKGVFGGRKAADGDSSLDSFEANSDAGGPDIDSAWWMRDDLLGDESDPSDTVGMTDASTGLFRDTRTGTDLEGDTSQLKPRSNGIKARKPLPALNEKHDVTFRGGATAIYQKSCPRDGCDGDVQYQPGQLSCLQCGWVLYSATENAVKLEQSA